MTRKEIQRANEEIIMALYNNDSKCLVYTPDK